MPDKYVQKQLNHYSQATSQPAKDDALYRAGTYLEVHPCGEYELTPEQRQTILDAAKEGDKNA